MTSSNRIVHDIAVPILKDAFKPDVDPDLKMVAGHIRHACNEENKRRFAHGQRLIAPCVIEDWAHEPRRRVHMKIQQLYRRQLADRATRAQAIRREQKNYAKKKTHRTMQKIGRAMKNFAARITFRHQAKG